MVAITTFLFILISMSDELIMKLDEYWPYQAAVLADLISKHTTSVLKRHGELNLSQWRVLAAVSEKEGRTSADIVKVTPMDKGIVSRATATLVECGVLKKVSDKNDKRRSQLYTTKAGRKAYQSIRYDLMTETDDIAVSTKLNAHLLDVIARLETITTN